MQHNIFFRNINLPTVEMEMEKKAASASSETAILDSKEVSFSKKIISLKP